jgi:hypothetical protein
LLPIFSVYHLFIGRPEGIDYLYSIDKQICLGPGSLAVSQKEKRPQKRLCGWPFKFLPDDVDCEQIPPRERRTSAKVLWSHMQYGFFMRERDGSARPADFISDDSCLGFCLDALALHFGSSFPDEGPTAFSQVFL